MDKTDKTDCIMDTRKWNKATRQAFVGTLIYSLLGILTSVISPMVTVNNVARFFSAFSGGTYYGDVGPNLLLALVEMGVILGYVVFFLAIKDLRKGTEGEEQHGFKRIGQSIYFDMAAAFFGIFHLRFLGGLFGLFSSIFLVSAYSTLKDTRSLSERSHSAVSGFSLLFVAEIMILVGIVLGWIPFIKVFGSVLKNVAWILVLLGWRKVARPVQIEEGGQNMEEPIFETIKEVLSESVQEAKAVAKELL